jgi:hypothetical protein
MQKLPNSGPDHFGSIPLRNLTPSGCSTGVLDVQEARIASLSAIGAQRQHVELAYAGPMEKFVAVSLTSTLVAVVTGVALVFHGTRGWTLFLAPLLAFYGIWLGTFLCSEIRYALVRKWSGHLKTFTEEA